MTRTSANDVHLGQEADGSVLRSRRPLTSHCGDADCNSPNSECDRGFSMVLIASTLGRAPTGPVPKVAPRVAPRVAQLLGNEAHFLGNGCPILGQRLPKVGQPLPKHWATVAQLLGNVAHLVGNRCTSIGQKLFYSL